LLAHPAIAAAPITHGAPVLYADGPGLTRLHAEARRARARAIGALFARMLRAVAAAVRARADAWKRAYRRNLTVRTLSRLDTRTLRDLGLERSALLSAAYDLERDDYTTRLRTVRTANAFRMF